MKKGGESLGERRLGAFNQAGELEKGDYL